MKNSTKPNAKNTRLELPSGHIGVPPEHTWPVVIVARIDEHQYSEIINILGKSTNTGIKQ